MLPLYVQLQNSTLRGVIKRLRFPLEIMLVCVRWYAAYPLSTRNLEEMMEWKDLCRAVDQLGQMVDFLLTGKRDLAAARRFFERAIDLHDVPEKVTIDKSGANTAAVLGLVADSDLDIELRQSKYLNNLVEQDHRAIKRRARPMMGFGSFATAAKLIAGIETMHAVKKGQLGCHQGLVVSDADRFYSLATR